jgi:hypothetical protein
MHIPDSITKSKIVFLTGAGASVPLGCLATKDFLAEFTRTVANRLDQQSLPGLSDFLTQVYVQAARADADIETILGWVERNIDDAQRLAKDQLFQKKILFGSDTGIKDYIRCNETIRDLIYDDVIARYSAIDSTKAAALYRQLFKDYVAWFGGVPRLGRTIPWFTLNYDLAVEAAASQLQMPLVDGLIQRIGSTERRWSRSAFEDYKELDQPTVILVKLHGSVRWGREAGSAGVIEIAELAAGVGRDPGKFKHVVLYPSELLKPLHIEPFRTSYRIFRNSLEHACLLVVIGCSLRDREIQVSISDAMDDNPGLHLLLIGPEVDHGRASADLQLDANRVVAVRRKFEVPPDQGQPSLMGCLRGYAHEACGGPEDISPSQEFRFGVTHDDWPWMPRLKAISQMKGGTS